MNETILTFENVGYAYEQSGHKQTILNETSYAFQKGVFYAIVGPSGSGKTTAVSLAAGLDEANEGKILYENKDIKKIGLNNFRRKNVTMVFQSYNLLTYMTPLQNVLSAMSIGHVQKPDNTAFALEMLAKVGLDQSMAMRNVKLLSGGQQQRVAIARALCSDADLIVADEPTGNLDRKTAADIVRIFQKIAHEDNKCLIVVTHSQELANSADVILEIHENKLVEITTKKSKNAKNKK